MKPLPSEFRPLTQREIIKVLLIIVLLGLVNIFITLYSIVEKHTMTFIEVHSVEMELIDGTNFAKYRDRHVKEEFSKGEVNRPRRRSNTSAELTIDKAISRNLVRVATCDGCFPHNFEEIVNNKNICSHTKSDSPVDLLILITSSPTCRSCRDAIRETWLQQSKNNTETVRYVFLLGAGTDDTLMNDVINEANHFGDMVIEDFVDSYYNLTFKTMMGFKWATKYCSQAKYVLKTDDDIFVNIDNVLEVTRIHKTALESKVVGSCALWKRPIRDPYSKWHVSRKSYRWTFLPPYCSGTGYLLSMGLVKRVRNISSNVSFFHLEDVYVGLCLLQLRYSVLDVIGFNRVRHDCVYRTSSEITMHYMGPSRLREVWKNGKVCFNETGVTITDEQ